MNCPSGNLGGVIITTDGTNAAVVIIQINNDVGKKVFDISTKTPGVFILNPISLEGSTVIYYSITGTGAAAQLYEYVA